MRTAINLVLLTLCVGCTVFHTVQSDIGPDGKVTRTTDLRAYSFFDAATKLQNARVSTTDKTQSSSLSGLDQSSSGSNAVAVLRIIVEGASKAVAP